MTLPNFLIIGAAKAGTTSLYHYLRQHPDVFMSAVKEPNYFCSDDLPALAGYERLFSGAANRRAIGEASTQYLNSRVAPDRIARVLPEVRLIVSLRNPADRAYSSYLGRVRGGQERRRVEEALRPGTYYFESSFYHRALSHYFERFPVSRIKVLVFDDLAADPASVVRDLCAFLEIETFTPNVRERHGAATMPRSIAFNALLMQAADALRRRLPPRLHGTGLAAAVQRRLLRPPDPLPATLRSEFLKHFRHDIEQTSALVQRDLTHWLAPTPNA